jgi:hypothetical protein
MGAVKMTPFSWAVLHTVGASAAVGLTDKRSPLVSGALYQE